MGNYCEQVVHSRYTHLFTVVTAGQRSPGPPAGRDRRAGHPRSLSDQRRHAAPSLPELPVLRVALKELAADLEAVDPREGER